MLVLGCGEACERLLDFLDGALEPGERDLVSAHFRCCAPCAYFLATYSITSGLCAKAFLQKVPAGLAERLLADLREKLRPTVANGNLVSMLTESAMQKQNPQATPPDAL